jgi:hypothetical protein
LIGSHRRWIPDFANYLVKCQPSPHPAQSLDRLPLGGV